MVLRISWNESCAGLQKAILADYFLKQLKSFGLIYVYGNELQQIHNFLV
jgi:hypothetical protein